MVKLKFSSVEVVKSVVRARIFVQLAQNIEIDIYIAHGPDVANHFADTAEMIQHQQTE